ncbi:MAG: sensor histidine kinase [Clostridia bacterium]|nr:sensor histidine kinase [Clostridia bacterium]
MQMLLLYRMLVVVELFVAEFMFAMRLHRRKLFSLRFICCFVAEECVALLLPAYYNAVYTSFTFFLLFLISVPIMVFCCNESWKTVFFCTIAAYTMQHLAYGISNFFMTIVNGGESPILGMYFEGKFDLAKMDLYTLLVMAIYAFSYFSAYTAFYYLYIRKIKPKEEIRIKNTGVMLVIGFALIVDILLNSIIVYHGQDRNILTVLMNTVYETLCCGFLLSIQFGLIKTGELKNELDVTQYLLREKEKQYNISKDNIELINLKCHDLRHQIRSISKQQGLSAENVKEIEKVISIYDAAVRTGNEVLDTILTEKSLKCKRDGITLACVADGYALEFMTAADVYSLFGNALENAMEAVMLLPEKSRNISVAVHKVGDMVSVNVTNPFSGALTLDDGGLPVTTKEDKNFHGIGLRSMCKIAEKYGGICSASAENDVFVLNVLMSCAKKS